MTKSPARTLYKRRTHGTLKGATAALVEACGGIKRAAELARVGRSQMHRYTDDSDEHAGVAMPADVIAMLEGTCRTPCVTEYLAAQLGLLLFDPEPAPDGDDDVSKDIAAIAGHASRLFGDFAAAYSDHRLSRAEAARLLSSGDAMVRAYMTMRSDLAALVSGVAPAAEG
ncbi:hypothetical protein [Azospirillum sp. A39]|uniref:hypothetical protein n=1 Tax=Azospirillum sp. A39 TaxID=3462279 RepID=UPI0040459BF2